MAAEKQKGVLFSVLASLSFGISPVFIKLVLDFTNIETMNVLLTVFSCLFFGVIFTFFRSAGYFHVVVKNWRFLAFLGLFEAAGSLLFTYGILISGPTNAAFVAQFTVVFTILFGVIFLKEKLANREVLGVVVALVGLFILTSGSVQLEIFSTVAVLISAVLFAAANLFSKVYIKDINPMSMAGGRSFFMLIILLIYALALGKLETAISPLTLGYAILGSVTGVILSFIFFFKALEVFEISKTMTIRSMEPLLTAVFSFALLALVPTMNQLIGGILIVSGVVALSYTAR